MERTVTPIGTSGKAHIPRTFIRRRVCAITTKILERSMKMLKSNGA
jgi:hypothetical protein